MEIAADVADAALPVIVEQVAGVSVRMAVLYRCSAARQLGTGNPDPPTRAREPA